MNAAARPGAVVFAYHNVGVRCLKVLLAGGVDVRLVVTHADAAGENIWFASVAETARSYGIPVAIVADPNEPAFRERIAALAPEFIFSFYYRQMLGDALLALGRRGALNMHGSLLPAYRGRVPVNWAVLHGETRSGATLHHMVTKPDAGDIVAQTEVPILPDDTAGEVFDKVLVAAETTLWRALPGLIDGSAPRHVQNLAAGSYFGGRRPEDGRIDWRLPARRIHDLIRAVAPPYPGAWTEVFGPRLVIEESRVLSPTAPGLPAPDTVDWRSEGERLLVRCQDGADLWIRRARLAEAPPPQTPAAAADALASLVGRLGLPRTLTL